AGITMSYLSGNLALNTGQETLTSSRKAQGPDLQQFPQSSKSLAHLSWTLHISKHLWLLFIWISCLLLKPSAAIPTTHKCYKTCLAQQMYPVSQACHRNNIRCDWQCEADRMHCSGEEEYHCAKVNGSDAFGRICATPKVCLEGQEPIIFNIGDKSIIRCVKCQDNYYNPTSASS
ncbi:hypothetical protein DPMN_084878, partial [Dreissena polymorpha]